MFKKVISFLLAMAMMCSFVMTTNAESIESIEAENVSVQYIESEILPLYNYTNVVTVGLSVSNGQARCTVSVSGYPGTTTQIQINMTLQKKTVLWWSKQASWSSTTSGYTAGLEKTATVGSGTYRVKAEITVYSGSNSEKITAYSQEVKV